MKRARPQKSETSAAGKHAHFNPADLSNRHRRIAGALLVRSRTREQIDAAAGASNGPDEVLRLRAYGLEIPCVRVPCIDRDGKEVQRGVYSFTAADRRKVNAWLAKRQAGVIDAALAGWIAFSAVCAALLLSSLAKVL